MSLTSSRQLSYAKLDTDRHTLFSETDLALKSAIRYASDLARDDGHWCGELRSNATITAEYVFLRQALGLDMEFDKRALCQWLLSDQNHHGSWSIAPDYPGDVSTTTEAYLALKILGIPADDPVMQRARDFVIEAGGIAKVRIFTRIYLAIFGLFPWDAVPELPAELILMPAVCPINIYTLSSWARSTVIPMLVMSHHQPVYALPNMKSSTNDFLDELWCNAAEKMVPYCLPLTELWKTDTTSFVFAAVDKVLHRLGGLRKFPTRDYARRKCIDWILAHQEKSGDWAGIFPPMQCGILALTLEGFSLDDPCVSRGLEAIERFAWHDERGKRMQACVSPVWDTILMSVGLCDAGVCPSTEILTKAINWIKAQQQLGPEGDWRIYSAQQAPGGFSFEYSNTWYPDVDDTGAAIIALLKHDPSSASSSIVTQAAVWILGMQNRDGGWAAFDTGNDQLFLNKIPFSDMDSLCDPSTADVTGRVLEAFGMILSSSHAEKIPQLFLGQLVSACYRGISYFASEQEHNGSWYGRWGSNYLYGTSNVLCSLVTFSDTHPDVEDMVSAGIQWLKSVQDANGGWGEGVETYKWPEKSGSGVTTASQTAWALMALLSHLPTNDVAIRRGIEFLLSSQTERKGEGKSWPESQYTGTGFPNFFYIGYELYSHYFPMMALGRYKAKLLLGE
ncbi:hypothetical protein ACEPPN_006710 [Leptodophora sp. 'Broadleaf-Isolate-01']